MQRHLKLVTSGTFRSPAELPEVLLVRRLNELRDAWLAMPWTWWLPQAWCILCGALDRYEGQRLRTLRMR